MLKIPPCKDIDSLVPILSGGPIWPAAVWEFLSQISSVSQLFYFKSDETLALIVVKTFDDVGVTGKSPYVYLLVSLFDEIFAPGTIDYGPSLLNFYGLKIIQRDEDSIKINPQDNISALEPYPVRRMRRRRFDELLKDVEKRA